MAEANILERILPYIPSRFVHLLERSAGGGLRRIEPTRGVVLFFDISGFTNLVADFAEKGDRGTETIMGALTNLYTEVLTVVQAAGGVAYQFAGDSVLIGFDLSAGESETELAERAVAAAWKVNEDIKKYSQDESGETPTNFRVKQGLAFGDFHVVLLGAGESYYSPALVGAPVQEAVYGQQLAVGGEVVLGASIAALLGPVVDSVPMEAGFVRIEQVRAELQLAAPAPLVDLANDSLLRKCQRFIAPNLLQRVVSAHAGFLGEFRHVSAAMIRFDGLDYRDRIRQDVQQLNRFYEFVQQLSRQYSGTLLQTDLTDKGNVFVVLFGAPIAVENKELLACRFAYKVQQALADFPFIKSLQIGIATGAAYCGDLGATFRKGYTLVGPVVNLAARLMTFESPAIIHVCASTEEKTRKSFTYKKFENVRLKGFIAPHTLYSIQEEIERFRGILLKYGIDAMIGRRAEYDTLKARMRTAFEGSGQICVVLGEAGIGKSKIAGKLLDELKSEDAEPLIGYCYSYEKFTPYFPWRELLLLYFQIFEFEDNAVRADKLRRGFANLSDVSADWAPVLGQIMGIQMEETALTRNLDPRQKNERISEIIVQLLEQRSLQTPLVLYFEDCHWADEVSLRLISYVAGRLQRLPILLLLVARPDIHLTSMESLPNYTRIDLGELPPDEAREFLRSKLRLNAPNEALENIILGSSPGNPFFVESMVQSLVEQGRLESDGNGHNRLVGDPSEIKVPGSLQDVVLSRIDGLAERDKMVLKTASVIGRIFPVETLSELTPNTVQQVLPESLRTLQDLDLTPLETEYPTSYIFKHIVIRDVAYNTLLVSTREDLHRRLATYLEQRHIEQNAETPDVLAYHFMQGRVFEAALKYALMAARRSRGRYANSEAIYYYEQAIGVLERPEFAEKEAELYQIREELAEALTAEGRYDEAKALYSRCLAYQQDPLRRADLHGGLGRIYQEMGDYHSAVAELETGLRLVGGKPPRSKGGLILTLLSELVQHLFISAVKKRRRPRALKRTTLEKQTGFLRTLGKIYFWVDVERVLWTILALLNMADRMRSDRELSGAYGDWAMFQASLGLYDRAEKHLRYSIDAARHGNDPMSTAVANGRMSAYYLYVNDPGKVVEHCDIALNIYRQIGEVWERLVALGTKAQGYYYAGKFQESSKCWDELHELAIRYETRFHQGWAMAWRPFYSYMLREASAEETYAQLRAALAVTEEVNDQSTRANVYYNMICVALREGHAEEAARLALKTYEVISNYRVIVPHTQYAFVHAGEAALFALRSGVKETPVNLLKRTLERCQKRSLALGKRYPFLRGPSLRLRALALQYSRGPDASRSAFLDALAELEQGHNEWELAVCLTQAADVIAERRSEFLDKAKTIFDRRGMAAELRSHNLN